MKKSFQTVSPDNEKQPSIFLAIFVISIITLILITATIFHSINVHSDIIQLATDQFNRQQSILARSVANQIENFLTYIDGDLFKLSEIPCVANTEEGTLEQIQYFYKGIPPKTSLRILDKNGILGFIYPDKGWRTSLIGKDYHEEAYFQKAVKTRKTVISGLISNESGDNRIRVARPIIIKNPSGKEEVNGVIVGSFDPASLSVFVSPVVAGKTGYAWLLNEEGIFLAHYEKDFLYQNAFHIRQKKNPEIAYDVIDNIQREMIAGKEGITRYISGWHRNSEGRVEKFIAYTPVHVFDKIWSVAVCAPVEEVEEVARKSYRNAQYTLGMIIFILIIGSICAFIIPYRWSKILHKEIKIRKQIEYALGESIIFSTSLICAMKDGLIILNNQGVHLDVNSAFCQMTGYSSNELIGKGLPHPYWAEEGIKDIEYAYQKMQNGEFEDFELIFKRKNGERFPVIFTPSQITDDHNNFVSFFANIKNIENRKRIEEALRAGEKRLRRMIEKMPVGIVIVNKENIVRFANPAAEVFFDETAEELTGKVFGFPIVIGETAKIEIQRKNGETGIAEMRVVEMNWNQEDVYLASLRDISDRIWAAALEIENAKLEAAVLERKRSEESVRLAYTELNQIFQSAGDGMCVIDKNFKILKINKRFEKIFNIDRNAAIDRKCYEILGFDICGKSECPITRILNGEEFIQYDIKKEFPDGLKMLGMTATPMKGSDEKLIAVIYNFKDLTRRYKAEKTIQASEIRYRTIFENAGVAIIIVDEDTTISMANHEFENLTGYNKEEMEKKMSWKEFFTKNQWEKMESYHYSRRIDPAIAPRKYESTLVDKAGNIKDMCLTVTMIPETKQSILSLLNMTDLKQARKEVQLHLEKLQVVMKDTIQAMALTIEKRDLYTSGHQKRVANLACAIAQEMELPAEQIEGIRMAGVIHDLGKIRVPAAILNKPDRLSYHEFGIIKDHPLIAYDILKKIEFPWPVAQMVYQHHERLNGSGYPQGLTGDNILLEARILAVADVVDAMSSHRPYRPSLGVEKALEEISKNKGITYDSVVVDICLKLFREKQFEFNQEENYG